MATTQPSSSVSGNKRPLSVYMPQRLPNGWLKYLSYPSNRMAFVDEHTGRTFWKEPNYFQKRSSMSDVEASLNQCGAEVNVQFIGHSAVESFTLYRVEMAAYGVTWEVTARYSVMFDLVKQLLAADHLSYAQFLSFPPRGFFLWNTTEAFVEQRKLDLERFFSQLLRNQPVLLRQNDLNAFLAPPAAVQVEVLGRAAQEGDSEACRWLAESGVDLDAVSPRHGWNAVHQATRTGHAKAVEVLLDAGAQADVPTDAIGASEARIVSQQGWTALHLATSHGEVECMRALLAHGADANRATADGCTPLIIAAKWNQCGAATVLLERPGIDTRAFIAPEVFNRAHLNALHIACQHGDTRLIQVLLDSGMDPNEVAQEIPGWTALHWAAQGGHAFAAQLLLKRGADIALKTKYPVATLSYARDTAMDIAEAFGHKNVGLLLASAAGERDSETELETADETDATDTEYETQTEAEDDDLLSRLPWMAKR